MNILDTPLKNSDLGDVTLRDYFEALLKAILTEGELFSGKRPLGNSGWEHELYAGLVHAGFLVGEFDEWGCLKQVNPIDGDKLLVKAVTELFHPIPESK